MRRKRISLDDIVSEHPCFLRSVDGNVVMSVPGAGAEAVPGTLAFRRSGGQYFRASSISLRICRYES
jgi:hypothetical protein